MAGAGHTVEMLTMADSSASYNLDPLVAHTALIRQDERKNKVYDLLLRQYRLFRYVKQKKLDAYVVMLPVTIIMLMLLRPFTDAKMIFSERNDPASYKPFLQKMLKIICRKADGAVFQTEHAKNWYGDVLDPQKTAVIPNAINPAFLRPEYTGRREKHIAAAGRLNGQKNFPLLIGAFAKIAEDFPEHKLVIYGQGAQKDMLLRLTEELGIGDRVQFPGFVPNMPEILEKAEMFVLSSDYEGMPNALMEAMALGLPCVSTDCGGGGARFLIDDGVNGLLVPTGNEQALADAMRRVLADPEMAAELGKNAAKLKETLAPHKIYGKWEAFFQQI